MLLLQHLRHQESEIIPEVSILSVDNAKFAIVCALSYVGSTVLRESD